MAPKLKITKSDIIGGAIELVRQSGVSSLGSRSLAAHLGCSTQPIFSNFSSMEELEGEVILAAYNLYAGFLRAEAESGKYPGYKAYGIAYIRFAREEKELFKLLFMRDRGGDESISSPDFDASVEMIMASCGLCRESATMMHLEIWSFVHGIAAMIATSFFTPDEELISKMTSDVYSSLREKFIKEELDSENLRKQSARN